MIPRLSHDHVIRDIIRASVCYCIAGLLDWTVNCRLGVPVQVLKTPIVALSKSLLCRVSSALKCMSTDPMSGRSQPDVNITSSLDYRLGLNNGHWTLLTTKLVFDPPDGSGDSLKRCMQLTIDLPVRS